MDYKLCRPCANCPFRCDLPQGLKGWLGSERSKELAQQVLKFGGTFPCHKTTTFEDDDEGEQFGVSSYRYTSKESQCAGAGIMQLKDNNPSQWMQIAERLGYETGARNLDLTSPVFESAQAFIEFHTDESN